MSQFRIKGIDYVDDSLQHGLGKGSGRGRPVGSKNGQVMPGAAYMKDYKIVGEKATGDENVPGAPSVRSLAQRAINTRNTANRVGSSRTVRSTATRSTPAASTTGRSTVAKSTPAANVARGKQAVESLISKGTNAAVTATQEPKDSPYSARRVNEAGGLASREGRQIVYDNPSLNDGYKKQVAQRYGDSDGKWYPKNVSETAADQPEPKDNPWSERRINEAGGLESREGRQYVYDNPTLNTDYKKEIAKRYGDSDGRSYPKEMERPASTESKSQETAAQEPTKAPAAAPLQMPLSQRVQSAAQEQNQANTQPAYQGPSPAANPLQQRETMQFIPPQANNQPAVQETPEQKSIWDNIGGWFAQAGKDIGDTAVGAWNAVSGAAGDAAKWVGDRLGDAGSWASTAYNDVKDWVGARGAEFGNWVGNAAGDVGRGLDEWWNGRDVEVNDNGRWRQGHEAGARERIGNFLNDVGQGVSNAAGDVGRFVGNAANDVGRGLDEWWNGRDVEVNDNGRWRQGHEAGFGERAGNFLNGIGQGVSNAVDDAGRFLDEAWNGKERDVRRLGENGNTIREKVREGGIRPALENFGQGVADTAGNIWNGVTGAVNDAGQAVNNFVNGVQPGTKAGAPYFDVASGQWVDPTMPSLGERISNGLNDAGRAVSNTAGNVWNGVTGAIDDAGRALNTWWNGDANNGNRPFDPAGTINEWRNGNIFTPMFDSEVARRTNGLLSGLVGMPNAVAEPNRGARGWLEDNFVTPAANAVNGVGNFVRNTANDAGRMINDNIVTPVTNAANDLVRGANDLWNGTDQHVLGIPVGHTPGIRENVGNFVNNVGQGIGNAANDAWNGVSGAANNLGRTANEWWNGTDQNFLGIPTGHTPGARENIENYANQAGRAIGDVWNGVTGAVNDAANNVGQIAGDTALAARAVRAGVPLSTVTQLGNAYANGQISRDEYEHRLDLAMAGSR